MKILEERIPFKPFEYQWAYDTWFKQQNAHWLHTEISMQSDVKDWEDNLTENEKNVIGSILKGFTQTECEVGNYWSSLVPKWFPVPEVKMMAQTFGAFETIHAVAYSYLNDTLGLDDFDSFLEDEETMNKLEALMNINTSSNWIKILRDIPDWVPFNDVITNWAKAKYSFTDEAKEIARSLAIFSAAAEGIQLFSSFAVLMSFRTAPSNRLKGISQQMIFSVRDESLHSEAGCKLYRTLIEQYPEVLEDGTLQKDVYKGIDLALDAEFAFIDKTFEGGELSTISKAQLKNFMHDRANRKLKELNLEAVYEVDQKLLEEMQWFYHMVSSEQQTDFFNNRETNYAKPNEDWNDGDLF